MVTPGPWIQAPNARLAKLLAGSSTYTKYGGLIDDDGTPNFDPTGTDTTALNAATNGGVGVGVSAHKLGGDTDPIDGSKAIDVRDSARDNIANPGVTLGTPFYNGSGTGTELSSVVFGPDGAAFYDEVKQLRSSPAILTFNDTAVIVDEDPEWDNPNVVGVEYHPDDQAASFDQDWGEALGMWATVAIELDEAEEIRLTANAIHGGDFDFSPTVLRLWLADHADLAVPGDPDYASGGGDRFKHFTTSPGSLQLGNFLCPTTPAGVTVAPAYAFSVPMPIDPATTRFDYLTDPKTTLPFVITSDALTMWGGEEQARVQPMTPLRVILDFYYRPARYRFLYDVETPVPPLRLHPRDDDLGVGSARLFPPPQSQQRGMQLDGYF